MAKKIIYQTLENRGNHLDILDDGPKKCEAKNAWLGSGHYFWIGFERNAHWWGREILPCDEYYIFRATIDIDDNNCLDLIGNEEHIEDFHKTRKLVAATFKEPLNKITVARVINFMKDRKLFPYSACKISGIYSRKRTYWPEHVVNFELGKQPFFDTAPCHQICIYTTNNLNFTNWELVHPESIAS